MKETKLYVIDLGQANSLGDPTKLSDDDFVKESERQGLVYSLKFIEDKLNYKAKHYSSRYVRFIEINNHE